MHISQEYVKKADLYIFIKIIQEFVKRAKKTAFPTENRLKG
jgi:hypothetical protein